MTCSLSKPIAALLISSITLAGITLHASPLEVVSYSFSSPPSANYPDPDMTKLTDGKIVEDSWWTSGSGEPSPLGAEVGWIQNPANPDAPTPAITFDFGEGKYVDEVSINYVLWPSSGVRAPNSVHVSYSFDGKEFILEEVHTGFDGSDHGWGYTIFTRNLQIDLGGKAARFVRLDFRQGPGDSWGPNRSAWHWFDEVSFQGRDIQDVNTPASMAIDQAVELEFLTEVGRVYQIQASFDHENWENFGFPILGNGEIRQLFTSTPPEGRASFRILMNE